MLTHSTSSGDIVGGAITGGEVTFLESVPLLCVDTKGKWLVTAISELLQTHNRKHKVSVKKMYNVIGNLQATCRRLWSSSQSSVSAAHQQRCPVNNNA